MVTARLAGQNIFNPAGQRLSIPVSRGIGPIAVDGVLDDVAWASADSVSDFIQIEPFQGAPSAYKTVVKILYDDKYLYFGVACFDSLGRHGIRVPDMMRDFNWRAHDTFAICIDGFYDRRNSVSFATNPYGTQKDYLSFDAVLFDSDWNGLWKVRTSITDEGWFAEFQIPWKTLRYSSAADSSQTWGVNFLRLRRASNEISVWSPYPRSFSFNRMEYAGELTSLQPPRPGTNISVNPYSLVSYDNQTSQGEVVSSDYRFKPGVDAKWALTNNTVADLTLNTDFAHADADVQVNNVSRFSVLFPEKRQFFLENASLFGPGLLAEGKVGGDMQMLPFFSRRIGLDDLGRPLPIHGGIRLANRSTRQNFGLMAVQQGRQDTIEAATFGVGRYIVNLGQQNRLGAIGVAKATHNSHTNLTGGLDGFFRFSSAHSLSLMATTSTNTDQTSKGFGGYAQYLYTSNRLTGWITQSVATKGFSPEAGFVSRKDVAGTSAGLVANLRGKYLPFRKYFRSYQPGISSSWYVGASSGDLTEREIRLTPLWIELQDGGYMGFSTAAAEQTLVADFRPLGTSIAAGTYTYGRYRISAGSDPSKKLSIVFQNEFGGYYNGLLNTTDVAVSIVPLPHISLTAGGSYNKLKDVGKDTGEKTVALYRLQGRLAFNPRVQLVAIYQRIVPANLDTYNIRFAWEYRPLSYLYVVLNSNETAGADAPVRHQQAIVKVSFLRQF